ncbi:unnamed protein product [Ilex paraguariensis]|uniref:Secreted protein n=1 Tax=Ilex paraguariensis TaxID=185542 RepID=A0ABC8TJM4_9AQUA
MVSPLIAQHLWFLIAIVMVIEVDVVVTEVVREAVRVVVEVVVDPVPILTVAVEDTLLIFVRIYMENLLVLLIRLLIRMTPLLLLPYLGQLHQTLGRLLLYWVERSMLSFYLSNRVSHLFSLLLLPSQSATSTRSVTLANGTCSKVSGLGTTHLSPDMSLSSMLFDLKTKRKIGTGHEAGGLYYLDFDLPT